MTDAELHTELIRRHRLLDSCIESSFVKDEIRKCARDPIHFCRNWLWTFDPNRDGEKLIPFVPFPKQEEFMIWVLERMENRESGVVIKPRQVGMTWTTCAIGLWMWLFRRNVNITYTSMKITLTDKHGDPKCVFYKLRKMLELLPPFLYPQNRDVNSVITNLDRNNTLTADGGDNPGRGGTATVIFCDEFANCQHQEMVDAAVSANSDSIIYMSTFSRPGNLFFKLALRQERELPVFEFKWWEDPRKTTAWYQALQKSKDKAWISREIDCDPYSSMEGQLIKKEWIDASVSLRDSVEITIPIPEHCGYDPAGDGDGCEHVVARRKGPMVLSITGYKGDSEFCARRALQLSEDAEMLIYDADGGWGRVARSVFMKENRRIIGFHSSGGGIPGFVNRRAAAYWIIRDRLRRTFELSKGDNVDPMDCLFIPNDGVLIDQLLSIRSEEREDGRIQIESKMSMLKKGIKSPDRADALVYSYSNELLFAGVKYA